MRVELSEQMSEGRKTHASSQWNRTKDQRQVWAGESRIVELETAGKGLGVGQRRV